MMRANATGLSERHAANTRVLAAGLLGLAIVGVSFSLVRSPWLVTGAVLGATVLAIALTAPLALVALMLMIGPVDLSFMTGGFKALFPGMGGLDMNGIRLLGATAGFMAYILFEPRAHVAAFGRLGRLWLVFLAFAAATLAFSPDRLEGLRLLLKLAYPFLTFLIVIGLANSRERVFTLMAYTLGAAAIFTLLVNPILALKGGYRIDAEGFMRVGGLGLGDNPFAFYLTAVLMIVFTRFLLRMQVQYLVFALVLIAWIALTVTRIAVLASLLGMVTIGILAAAASGNRKALLGALAGAALAAVILLPNALERTLGFVPTPVELLQLLRDPFALYNSINWQGRQLLWAILWGAFLASPFIGLGLGSSTVVIHETFPDQNVGVAHNEYMRLATDTGVLGVVLFLAAMASWFLGVVRLSRLRDQAVREFAFPAAAMIVAWLTIAATDNAIDYYNNFSQYIGFLVGGAVVAAAHTGAGEGA